MRCKQCPNPVKTILEYCSRSCSATAHNSRRREVRKKALIDGDYIGYHLQFKTGSWMRNLLIELFEYKCNACGINKWNNKPITLEVNHIDGVPTNNSLSNLEFLCANCHSQTPTFRALNKKTTRTHRKQHAGVA